MPYGLRLFLSLTALAFFIALVLCLFQYLISWIEAFLTMELPKTPLAISFYAIGILALSLLEYFLLLPPFYKGNVASMISLIEKERKVPCIKGILSVFLCCLISFLIGIPLGGEGPSVFIGALMGEGLFLWTKKKRDVFDGIAVGAATGFSVAFLNPLAGFCYLVEHDGRKQQWKRLLEVVYVLLLSYFLMVLLRHLQGIPDPFHYNLFRQGLSSMESAEHNLLFLLVPPFAFVAALLFKHAVLSIRNTRKEDYKMLCFLSSIFAALFVVVIRFSFLSPLLGIGTTIIHSFSSLAVEDALLFLFIRFLFTAFAFDSFYAGGQVLPALTIGYLLGLFLSALLKDVAGLKTGEETLLSLATMVAFYASVSDSYLTSLAISFSFGPFETMALPSLFVIGIVFLFDRFLFDTKSLSKMIVEYDDNMDKSERKLVD